jgi:hypothetical protein
MPADQRCHALSDAWRSHRAEVHEEYDETLHDVIGRVMASAA